MSTDLARAISTLGQAGCRLALVTASSLATLMDHVVPSLQAVSRRSDAPLELLLYVDSGTAAHSWSAAIGAAPLEDYESLTFTAHQVDCVLDAIAGCAVEFEEMGQATKVKPGQVNLYCGGDWERRRQFADFLESSLVRAGQDIAVMVPSAKDTIDIALCTKKRPVLDLLRRTHVSTASVLLVGDSMQPRAPDADMYSAASSALAVHVGSRAPVSGVVHSHALGPQGTLELLTGLLP